MASIKAIVAASNSFAFMQTNKGILTTVSGPLGSAEVEWSEEGVLVTPPREVGDVIDDMYSGENTQVAMRDFTKAFAK